MANHSKGLTSRITLRTSAIEQTIIQRTQSYMAEVGVTLSANDTILFLIQTAAMTVPVTEPEARAIIEQHWNYCGNCTDVEIRCAIGVHLRDAYTRVRHIPGPPPVRAQIPAGNLSPVSVAAASVAGYSRRTG